MSSLLALLVGLPMSGWWRLSGSGGEKGAGCSLSAPGEGGGGVMGEVILLPAPVGGGGLGEPLAPAIRSVTVWICFWFVLEIKVLHL